MPTVLETRLHGRAQEILRLWPVAAAWVVLVLADAVVYAYIKSKGVAVTGDEPHYLITAKALTHLTIHPLSAYLTDLRTHQFYNWPPGSQPTTLNLQLYAGPHGPVPTHSLGLSVLLAPFVAGGARLARIGLMAIEAAGVIYFYLRAAGIARLNRRGRVAFGLVIAAPAVWIAATQIYPDFLSGVLIACAAVDVAVLETRRRLGALGTTVCAVSLAVLPWLHQQNLVPAVLLLGALSLLARRLRDWRTLAAVAATAALSWVVLLAYNLYAYGNALGLPQPFPSLNGAGVTEILGLMFDRHQGLFIQVPTAALGLVGLWLARRAVPVAVIATLLAAGSLLYLNGTFVHAPYGGTSFAGRFQWSSLMPVLLWCSFFVAAIDRSKIRTWALDSLVVLLWFIQLVPVVRGEHAYYNRLAQSAPWDPATYPGWWPGVQRLLPELVPGAKLFGVPWFALIVVIALFALILATAAGAIRPGRKRVARLGAVWVAALVATGVLARTAPVPLPDRALTFSDRDVGGPLEATASPVSGPLVPLQGVAAGVYTLTVDYTLLGGEGSIAASCAPGSAANRNQPPGGFTALEAGTRTTVITLRCPAGTIWFQMAVPPRSSLALNDLALSKTAAN